MKNTVLKVLIGLVFLIGFNALFFLLGGFEHSKTEWISYGFIHVACLCLLSTPLFCKTRKGEAVLSASLYFRALLYFFIELIAGIAFIWYNAESPTWSAIVQSVMLMVFIVLQLMSVLANDATHASLEKQDQERALIRSLAENLKDAMRRVSEPTLRKKMSDCLDELNNSSLESFPEAKSSELALQNAVKTLCSLVETDDKSCLEQEIQNVKASIKQRNQAIRMARLS